MDIDGTLVLVGAGKMGAALLNGWIADGLAPDKIAIFDPAPLPAIAALAREKHIRLNPAIETITDAVATVLAIKPQMMGEVLPAYLPLRQPGNVLISIAAGKPVAFFEAIFGADTPIIRAMPNTPAAIGRGMSVLFANPSVSAPQKQLSHTLLSAVGNIAWIEDEGLMDPVTAVSGSGPAYVFLLVEALAQAGHNAGLDAELAYQLAATTVSGAGEMIAQSAEPAATLRENVTSPGGTTAAALEILMGKDGLPALLTRAVAAATERSKELAR